MENIIVLSDNNDVIYLNLDGVIKKKMVNEDEKILIGLTKKDKQRIDHHNIFIFQFINSNYVELKFNLKKCDNDIYLTFYKNKVILEDNKTITISIIISRYKIILNKCYPNYKINNYSNYSFNNYELKQIHNNLYLYSNSCIKLNFNAKYYNVEEWRNLIYNLSIDDNLKTIYKTQNTFNTLKELKNFFKASYEKLKQLTNDMVNIKMYFIIFKFLNLNYSYRILSDTDHYSSNNPSDFVLNKYGDCVGYGNLFTLICESLNLYCENVIGTIYDPNDSSNWNKELFHLWNVVMIDDNNYYFIDVTWGNFWFFIPPQILISTHNDINNLQLLKNKVDDNKYLFKADISFYYYNIVCDKKSNYISLNDTVSFVVNNKYLIYSNKRLLNKNKKTEIYNENFNKEYFICNEKGEIGFFIFNNDKKIKESLSHICLFIIN